MKRQMRKIIAGLLTFTFLAGLTGCGKDSGDVTPAKEFYYVPAYQNLEMDVDYVQNTVAVDDSIYMFASKWNQETGEGKDFMYCYQPLTGERKDFPLEKEGNTSIQQMSVNQVGNIVMMVHKYQMPEADVSQEMTTEATTEAADVVDESVTEEVVAETDAVAYEQSMEYKEWVELWEVSATDASVLNVVDIAPALESEGGFWAQYMALDGQDNVYFSDGNSTLYVLDSKGNKLFSKQVDNWIDGLFTGNDGIVYMKNYGETGPVVRPVNLQEKAIGEAVKSEGLSSGNSYNQKFYIGENNTLLVNDNSNVFTYDFATDIRTDLFTWLDADINSDSVQEIGQLSDGRFWALLCDYSGDGNEYSFVTLKKTPAAEVAVKEELIYGTMWLDQSVRKNIIDFNKSNEKYRITVKEYGSTDYEAGRTQLNNDITSGNCPDIIDISNVDFKLFAGKGVLEDLYPYMEKSGLNKDDYLENIFKAYESDGKLCAIVPQFYVTTVAAKASKVGDISGWTLQETLDYVKSSDSKTVFPYATRDTVFQYCIYNNIDEFINWETGECKFNGEEFIQVLEFVNGFPEEWDYSNQEEEGTHSKIMNDKILLLQTSISSVQEYQMMKGMFGGDVSFVGYPNSVRKGNLIQPTNGSAAISSKSKHKEGAWEFIRTLISEEYQSALVSERGTGWGFPVKKSALEKQFEKDMTPEYYKDENGNQVEQTKTSWGYDDFNIDIYAAKQEEIDAVREIIASAEKTYSMTNEELTKIVNEEAAAFFKGQKSAKETADIIQNRVQIYVNENR